MAARAPRHLAEPPKRFGRSPLQRLFLVAMLALAAVTAAISLLTREVGTGGGREAAPATTRAQPAATTTPTSVPAARPIRPTPGNLLSDGDFERDLGGWTPLGGASVERVGGGASGRWAVAVTPGESRARLAGMARSGVATSRSDTTYEAIFWVRSRAGGQVASSEEAGYTLPDAGWHQLAVEHHTRVPGSSLAVEIVGLNLPADGRLLVDAIDLQVE